jgi:hypothetical protein
MDELTKALAEAITKTPELAARFMVLHLVAEIVKSLTIVVTIIGSAWLIVRTILKYQTVELQVLEHKKNQWDREWKERQVG